MFIDLGIPNHETLEKVCVNIFEIREFEILKLWKSETSKIWNFEMLEFLEHLP